ncbi:ubiquinol-cytochrome C reductase complex subunit oxen [Leptinotarsa decemlineata]|uniref:ubiquinol-cytochrome C reductase complex subunit oxen n=1 Tax=Leptinotarsa decemlineata TaxID=7539 RepID=UPI003D30A661
MSISSTIYNSIFKRTSTMALAVVISAFAFERTFDLAADYIWETNNQGKLWKHIKDNYS